MAISKQCDRCKKLYAQYNVINSSERINGIMTLNLDHKQEYYKHGPYDLCPECCEEFTRWFKDIKEKI